MVIGAGRLWDAAVGEPQVELRDKDGNVISLIVLDVPEPAAQYNIACMLTHGHVPERTTSILQDGKTRDITHGYRYRAHLYYTGTNLVGRALATAIINHLGGHRKNTVKFYPHRDNLDVWHICKLDNDPDVDTYIEYRAIGYSLTLSLVGILREPTIPSQVPTYMTDFTSNLIAYAVGDHVRDFASVAVIYNPADMPGYFSEDSSHGNPELPPY